MVKTRSQRAVEARALNDLRLALKIDEIKEDVFGQQGYDAEIERLCLRVLDLEGLLEVDKNFSADLQKELDVAREREEQALLYNAEYAEEYEALISQYENRLDDNLKHSLKLEEAKSQVEDKTATLLSKDLALNQLISEPAELKDSVRLDRLKTDLRRLKVREAKSRADLAEVQAMNKSLVDDLAYIYENVRRAVQRDKEMNERINQLCARITELERELRAREMKYEKDLKLELDKRDGKIASGEGSREMKEFLHQKEEFVENMRIDLINSQQKSIDLTRQMSERIDQLTAELAESKARRLRGNKPAAVTHQSFKELVVHEQDKCDGEALDQRQLSALVVFFVEEIKFLQVERDLIQDCFFGRTCVCKSNISNIDPIGVMDRGIGTTTAEQIARGRKIVFERAPKYMASRTEIGGSSSAVSPTPAVGGRSTALPSRKSSIIKKK
ncbi:hypothetical protein GIB67_007467 [Kingdonia uniflora]|uniref:Uncharacterized protein n=1 Tax=Kingdonia uniflora TaxID=39325 RepID=A0A7J7MMU6_9MAGN|nr:hypothetical protein GIB67_007467 [Kingdonia uniflora]